MRYIQQKNTPRRGSYIYDQKRSRYLLLRRFAVRFALFVGVVVLAGVVVARFLSTNLAEDALLAIGFTAVKGETAPKVPSLDTETSSALKEDIEAALAKKRSIQSSVSIIDIKTGDSYNYGSSGVFLGASVNKMITATLYMKYVDQKKASLNTTIQGQKASVLLTKLIEKSDNNAWAALNGYLKQKSLKQWAIDNNWKSYNYITNTINSADAARLLAALYKGELLSRANTDILLNHMKQANETNHIVANVPEAITVYHKAGWLDDHVHDAAIIDNGSRPYVLVVFTKGSGIYSSGATNTMYADITAASLRAFNPSS